MADNNAYGPLDFKNHIATDPRNKTASPVETLLKENFPLYNLFLEFPTAPIVGQETLIPGVAGALFRMVSFPAYISSAITDTYNPSFSDIGPVFGRMDPIPVYQRTTRTIKVDFNIPANDINDARLIRAKLDVVAKNCYPTYRKSANSDRLTIYKPPLIRLKFGNIICNPINQFEGLLGYLSSGITISHDLAGGVFTEWPGQEIYAKKYSLSISMSVLHEFTPGFVQSEQVPSFLGTSAILSFPGAAIETAAEVKGKFQTEGQKFRSFGVGRGQRVDIAKKLMGL